MTQLAQGHPVFLVEFAHDRCVIKQDNMDGRANAGNVVALMNAVDPGAQSRVLGTGELLALRAWVNANQGNIHLAGQDQGFLVYLSQIIEEASRPPLPPGMAVTPQNQRKGVWTVMQAKANLMDVESAAMQRVGGNKASVKAITERLRAPGGLEKIGQILAVDAFNNYGDRVNWLFLNSPNQRRGKNVDGMPEKCRCMWNPGNFFVDGHEGVLGLDPIDPNTAFNDWQTMPDLPTGEIYAGTILKQSNGHLRAAVAEAVIEDLELLLGPRNRRGVYKVVGATHRMPKNGAARIVSGIETGAALVLAHLRQTYAGGNIPVGLQLRLQACGWLNPSLFPRL
jgi:hypothetical protein